MSNEILFNKFTVALFGETLKEAHEKHICICCKKSVLDLINDPIDMAEYNISGICPKCWEEKFSEE